MDRISLTWNGTAGVVRCKSVIVELSEVPVVPGLGQIAYIAFFNHDIGISCIMNRGSLFTRGMSPAEMYICEAWLRRIYMGAMGELTAGAWNGVNRRAIVDRRQSREKK